ncbi:MAG: 50S ribosomal protein L17 [Patescibacteria group bacterium]
MANSLSRKKDSRKSLLRNLVTSLVLYEEIKTTEAKAKEVKPIVEHLIFIARKNDLAARRKLLSYLFDKKAVKKVFEVLVPRYKDLNSGYVLSYRIGKRLGDSASLMILKLKEGKLEELKEKEKDAKDNSEPKASAKKPAKGSEKIAKTSK